MAINQIVVEAYSEPASLHKDHVSVNDLKSNIFRYMITDDLGQLNRGIYTSVVEELYAG